MLSCKLIHKCEVWTNVVSQMWKKCEKMGVQKMWTNIVKKCEQIWKMWKNAVSQMWKTDVKTNMKKKVNECEKMGVHKWEFANVKQMRTNV